MLEFLIRKSKFYERHSADLNSRQKKVIERIFKEGLSGFKGSLSAENYISITKVLDTIQIYVKNIGNGKC
jgi:hypothetical protein